MLRDDHSLNSPYGDVVVRRSRLLRVASLVTLVLLFAAFAVPLVAFFTSGKASATQIVIAVSQTLTLCWALGHPLAVTAFAPDAFSPGLAVYVIMTQVFLGIYLSMLILQRVLPELGTETLPRAEVGLLGATLGMVAITAVLSFVKRTKREGRQFGKNPVRLNMVSLLFGGVVAALACSGLVLDYRHRHTVPMTMSELMFPNMFFFGGHLSPYSIVSTLMYLAALCGIPYTLTILRISVDKELSKSDRLLSIFALAVIVVCQLCVFVAALVAVLQHSHVFTFHAPIVLLLLVTAVIFLRGIAYTLYVRCVVDRQIEGKKTRVALL